VARVTGVVDKEEYQEHRVRCGKRDAGDDVNGFSDSYRMRRHFTFVSATVVSYVLLFLYKKSDINKR